MSCKWPILQAFHTSPRQYLSLSNKLTCPLGLDFSKKQTFFIFQADNSCRVLERHGHRLLTCLVGDSLLEPFWPTGTGCARGFFGGLDACWLMRTLALGKISKILIESATHLS